MKRAGQGEETVSFHNLNSISVIRRKRTKQLSSIVWPDRFKSKIALDKQTGCWNWTGATKNPPGYPQFKYGVYAVDGRDPRSMTGAHQFAYEFVHGPLLDLRLDVDHICHNKLCVNPRHLRAITHRDNCNLRKKRQRVPGSQRWLKEQVAK